MNTCRACCWSWQSFIAGDGAILKCWPGGDSDAEQEAGIPCLKWEAIEDESQADEA